MKWSDLPKRKTLRCDYCNREAMVTDGSGLRFCHVHLPDWEGE
jgi:hypothetical protein